MSFLKRKGESRPALHATSPSVPTAARKDNGGLFWWVIAIIILTGIAIFSWVFCLYVFSYPDKPFNYRILNRFEKLEPLMAFKIMEVPGGPQLTAMEIYQEYHQMAPKLRTVKNGDLLRAYIWNYKEDDSPVYITGKFEAIESRPLTKEDLFPSGVVVRSKSVDYPTVFLDFVFPTKPEDGAEPYFIPGDILTLEKRRLFATVINFSPVNEEDLLITAVSLIYGRYRIDDRRAINQEPPPLLNVESALPVKGMKTVDSSLVSVKSDGGEESKPVEN